MNTSRLNGRHLTAIVAAVCLAIVLAPISVLATSAASRVWITDPGNSKDRAHVSSSGELSVAPGIPGTPFSQSDQYYYDVPAGKRLVVQTIGVEASVTSGNSISAQVEYHTGGKYVFLHIPLSYSVSAAGSDFFNAVESVSLYLDGGTRVSLLLYSPSAGTFPVKALTVSGYLI